MSSTLDDHIRAALDRIRVSLSGQLEADLSASTSDILLAVADEHRRALVDVTENTTTTMRAEAEQRLLAAREEFAGEKEELDRQREEVQRSLTAEIGGLERVIAEVRDEIQTARGDIDDLRSAREALEHLVEQQRVDIDLGARHLDEHRLLLDESRHSLEQHRVGIEQHRHDLEQRTQELEQANRDLEQTRQDLERSTHSAEVARHELQQSIAEAQDERERVRRELASVTQEADDLRGRLAQIDRLKSALRSLDEAQSLGDILEHLAQSACQETGRTAVFLVNGSKLRGWRALGFPGDEPIVGSDFDPADSGVVGQVVRSGAGQQHRNGDATHLPPFARADGPRDAVALPVQVDGSVIAVLYADAVRADRPEDPEWLDAIDAMAKHAGRVLEAMTVRRAAALWTPREGTVRSSRE